MALFPPTPAMQRAATAVPSATTADASRAGMEGEPTTSSASWRSSCAGHDEPVAQSACTTLTDASPSAAPAASNVLVCRG